MTWPRLAAISLDVVILALMLWLPVALVVRSGRRDLVRILKWCILIGLLIPINWMRMDPYVNNLLGEILRTRSVRIALSVVGVALAVFLLARWEKLSFPLSSVILVVLLPLLPFEVVDRAWALHSRRLANKPLLSATPQKPGAPHVLWIVFDEWDQVLTFDARAADLKLPELDQFRDHSFYAGHAYPPAQDTLVSVPSLLSGKTFTNAVRQGASEVLGTYDPRQPHERLTTEPTIFGQARRAGFNVGVVGWFLPYCRLFGDFTSCPAGDAGGDTGHSLGGWMLVEARDQYRGLPLMKRLGFAQRTLGEDDLAVSRAATKYHAEIYQRLRQDALQTVRDPRLNLVFLHFNVPHFPPIYDAAKQSYSTSLDGTFEGTYKDNLALVDQTLGEIRQTLEQAGTWDSTTILLTSDHPFRVSLWRSWSQRFSRLAYSPQSSRVPFLLKMAGQKQGVDYPRAIQTVVTKDLLLEVLNQKVTTAEEVAAWLDHNPPRR